ncbi:MAG: HAD family hydrolase [Clostridia bacterium]|nr:HAD family hydrolase [Clostridia bacterium]
MNPWKSQNYKKIYDNQDIRTGIALRFEKGVHGDIKSLFTDFTKWLRKNYYFPIRVAVYIKASETIKLMNGSMAWGSFRYFDTFDEPYIRIPTGDYLKQAEIEGKENAAYTILSSFVHELTHYFQWVNQFEQTDRGSEWQANYYRNRIIDLYLNEKENTNQKFKAIFFDRDGTLTYFTAEKEAWRDRQISSWSGKPFELDYDKMMSLFHLASEGRKPWYKTLDDEREFFRRYYYHLLVGEGVTENIEEKAECLLNELWCNGDRALFPETVEVLKYFKSRGYKMGVISDTSPSLEFTLQQLGIAKYFSSFTASSLVGAGKPSPIIFNAALKAQGVTAEESIFVDDCKEEADGARKQGFTAFYLDRSGENNDKWTIHNLKQLIKNEELK